MDALIIEGTKNAPKVCFDPEAGTMLIHGRSIPENVIEFYKPLVIWLNSYLENPQQHTEVHFKLEYFNTSSSKAILDLMKILEKLHDAGKEVNITWYYEVDDEDMLETGEDYNSIVKIPFEMVEVDNISLKD